MRPSIRPAASFLASLCACVVAACGLAACGGSSGRVVIHKRKVHPGVSTLEIYSSLPLTGPSGWQGTAVARGIRLALHQAGGRAGQFRIVYRSLNDARGAPGSWSDSQTAANARRVVTDAAAMAYVGELDSAATQVSAPILNQAGIPQITPWSPYVGLTQSVPGVTGVGEPIPRYAPTGARTLLRIAPDDGIQVAAILSAFHAADCSRLAVLQGSGGGDLSSLLSVERLRLGMRIVSNASLSAVGQQLRRYVLRLRALQVGCLVYVGRPSTLLADALALAHLTLPRAPIIASDRVCASVLRGAAYRALLTAAGSTELECAYPVAPPAPSLALVSGWQKAYGGTAKPGPWGTYGYGAMQLALQAIAGLGSSGDQRSRLLHALFTIRAHGTALGDVAFNAFGDSTVRSYGLYRVRAGGAPALVRIVAPPAVGRFS